MILSNITQSEVSAQITLSSISVNLGSIRTTQFDFGFDVNHLYTIYPELQIGGSLISKPMYWQLFWGYWDDWVSEPFPIMDGITYSSSSHIFGGRIEFLTTEFENNRIVDFGFLGGYSRHFTRIRYIGGHDFGGNPGHNSSLSTSAFDIGMNVKVKIFGPFRIVVEFNRFYQYKKLSKEFIWKRNAYKTGISYDF